MAGSARLLVPHLEGSRGYVAVRYVVFLRAPQGLGRHRQQTRGNKQYYYDFVPVLLPVVRASNAPHWSNNEASAGERAWKLTEFFLRHWRTLLVEKRSRLSLRKIDRVDPRTGIALLSQTVVPRMSRFRGMDGGDSQCEAPTHPLSQCWLSL